jgi:hypothetical protein
VADTRTLLEGIVNNLLRADSLSTTLSLISGDDDLAFGVNDTITQ